MRFFDILLNPLSNNSYAPSIREYEIIKREDGVYLLKLIRCYGKYIKSRETIKYRKIRKGIKGFILPSGTGSAWYRAENTFDLFNQIQDYYDTKEDLSSSNKLKINHNNIITSIYYALIMEARVVK